MAYVGYIAQVEFNLDDRLIIQIAEYRQSKRISKQQSMLLENLQLIPDNHNYNETKECPITFQQLPEKTTICYIKTLYDGNAFTEWSVRGNNNLDPITMQKINWNKVYKIPEKTVKNILKTNS